MAKVEPIDASIFSAWRAAWEDAALFSDDAIRDLRARIGSHHFYVVISVTFHGQPISCVFQNVPPRPQPVRSTDRSKAAHFSPDGWGSDPGIYLRRFDPIISMQGEQPCSFAEALAHAEELAQWENCPTIYAHDDTFHGRA